MKDIDKRNEELTFEEAIKELESIVAALEEGDVPLKNLWRCSSAASTWLTFAIKSLQKPRAS